MNSSLRSLRCACPPQTITWYISIQSRALCMLKSWNERIEKEHVLSNKIFMDFGFHPPTTAVFSRHVYVYRKRSLDFRRSANHTIAGPKINAISRSQRRGFCKYRLRDRISVLTQTHGYRKKPSVVLSAAMKYCYWHPVFNFSCNWDVYFQNSL